MRVILALSAVVLLAALLGGCDVFDHNSYRLWEYEPTPYDDDAWADDDTSPAVDDDSSPGVDDDSAPNPGLSQWMKERPYLQDRSLYRQDIDMHDPPWIRQLGCVGIGNGHVFGIVGNQYPLGDWHNLGGPDYQRNWKWFSDKTLRTYIGDVEQSPARESLSRVRDADVVIVDHSNDTLQWTSVNFAPRGAADPASEEALVSVWIVWNFGAAPVADVSLVFGGTMGWFETTGLHESDYAGRLLDMRPLDLTAVKGPRESEMRVSLGPLAAGEEKVVVVPMVFTETGQDPETSFAALEKAGVDALLRGTVNWWQNWATKILTVQTPDAKFNELLRDFALSMKVNQTYTGGISQMSQYSHVWLRDTHGPSLFYPLIGLGADFKAMLDYHWVGALQDGDLQNSIPANIDMHDVPAQPDWLNLPVMTGKVGAEGPSALVLEYENYYRNSGDLTTLSDRYGMLWDALMHQNIVDGCLEYFSGDETFGDMQQAVFGENILAAPDTKLLSFYSSVLWIRAAQFMVQLATTLGKTADAAQFASMMAAFKSCADAVYWRDDAGFWAIQADPTTLATIAKPYEDVSCSPIWLDALPLDDAHVVSNFENVKAALDHPNAALYSKLNPVYQMLFGGILNIKDGIQTGMSHGYWLNNLDKMFHPEADAAFELWRVIPTAAAATDEGVIVDDYSHLSLLREPFGFDGDTSARYRSWEAGILGHAFLYHLSGYAPDLPNGAAQLAPQLPPEWDQFALNGLAYGDGRFNLEVQVGANGGRTFVITTDATTHFQLTLTTPIDAIFAGATVNGAPAAATAVTNPYGRTVVRFAPFNVPAGATTKIVINAA
jgi:hypothetical protein